LAIKTATCALPPTTTKTVFGVGGFISQKILWIAASVTKARSAMNVSTQTDVTTATIAMTARIARIVSVCMIALVAIIASVAPAFADNSTIFSIKNIRKKTTSKC